MKRRAWAILVVFSTLAGVTLALLIRPGEPVPDHGCKLQRKASENPTESPLITFAWQTLRPLSPGANDMADLPETFNDPGFFQMQAGRKHLTVAINLSGDPMWCLDTDGDGRFSDEQSHAIKPVKEAGLEMGRVGPIRLTSTGGKGSGDAIFYGNTYADANGRIDSVAVYPAHYQYGELSVGPNVYGIAVVDGNFDGRFDSDSDDTAEQPSQSDVFAIDYDRNGQFEISFFKRSEVMPLGTPVRLDDVGYTINVARDGRRLDLKQLHVEQGTLAIDAAETTLELRLRSYASKRYLSITDEGQKLPIGKHRTTRAILKLRDSERNEWAFSASRALGQLSSFEIARDKTTRVRCGPPFVLKAAVIQRRGSHIVSISPTLTGCGGEQYALNVRRNNRSLPNPTFKIVDENGTVLTQGKFEYG